MQDRIYTKEVAEMTGRSISTVRQWRVKGRGPRFYSDGYRAFYLRHEVQGYLDAQLNRT